MRSASIRLAKEVANLLVNNLGSGEFHNLNILMRIMYGT